MYPFMLSIKGNHMSVIGQTLDLFMPVQTPEESVVFLQRPCSTFLLRTELNSGKVS